MSTSTTSPTLDTELRTHPFWRDYTSCVRILGMKMMDRELFNGFRLYLRGAGMTVGNRTMNVEAVRRWFEETLTKHEQEEKERNAPNRFESIP